MLLDLVVAEGEHKTLSISSLCMAAAVPQTTALRWLNYLVEAGLLLRTPNLNDSRSTFVRLTPKARRLMLRALAPIDLP
jgi:DNA-binding MarR family transcriptional regulator